MPEEPLNKSAIFAQIIQLQTKILNAKVLKKLCPLNSKTFAGKKKPNHFFSAVDNPDGNPGVREKMDRVPAKSRIFVAAQQAKQQTRRMHRKSQQPKNLTILTSSNLSDMRIKRTKYSTSFLLDIL